MPSYAQTPDDPLASVPADQKQLSSFEMEMIIKEQKDLLDQRTRAEAMLRDNPKDFKAQLLLGFVLHRAEGDLARARYHLEKAHSLSLPLYKKDKNSEEAEFHRMSCNELLMVYKELEMYQKKIDMCQEVYDDNGDERWIAEMAWSYMKLGKEEDARRSIQRALDSGKLLARLVAWNSLAALEASLEHNQASYEAISNTNRELERLGIPANATFLRNQGKTCPRLGKYEESERYYSRSASRPFQTDIFINPHRDLMYLYLGQARFSEAKLALQECLSWSKAIKPFLYQQSMAEDIQAEGVLLLELGHPHEAVEKLRFIIQRPDRRGAAASHVDQSESGNLLAWRTALYADLERNRERLDTINSLRVLPSLAIYCLQEAFDLNILASKSHHARIFYANLEIQRQIDKADKRIVALAAENNRLRSSLLPYNAQSLETQEWYRPELIELWGTGLSSAILDSIAKENREQASLQEPFLEILRGEVQFFNGNYRKCSETLSNALAKLPRQEALLHLRTSTRLGMALMKQGEEAQAAEIFSDVAKRDGAMLRTLGAKIPLTIELDGALQNSALGSSVMRRLKRSPRFCESAKGLRLSLSYDGDNTVSALLTSPNGTSCKNFSITAVKDSPISLGEQIAQGIHDLICSAE